MTAARKTIASSRDYLRRELESLGVAILPSHANFLLARVGDGAWVRGDLLRRGIAVRDCASFGLPEYIRIAVRRAEECRRLIEALGEVLGDK